MELLSISELSEMYCRLIDTSDVNLFNSVVKLVLSALLGSVIGFERKSKGQNAGVGTFALISVGATLAMILSIYIPQEYLGLKNGDPGRIAAQVITGIGFLGAGTIIQMKGSIKGLTTAAGIWLVAMIGMAVGAGLYAAGMIATGLMLVVLVYFAGYEQHVNIGWKSKTIRLEFHSLEVDLQQVRRTLSGFNVRVVDVFMRQDFDSSSTVLNLVVQMKANTDLESLFKAVRQLAHVKSVMLDSDFRV